MYRFKLCEGNYSNCLLEDSFSSPVEMNEFALKRAAIRELNRKIGYGSYPERDEFNNEIDYSLEVYLYVDGKPAFTGNPVVDFSLSLVDCKFHEPAELILT